MVFLTIDQAEAIDKFLTDLIDKIGENQGIIGYTRFSEEFMKCKRVRKEIRKVML